jgi:hypothetical protein
MTSPRDLSDVGVAKPHMAMHTSTTSHFGQLGATAGNAERPGAPHSGE